MEAQLYSISRIFTETIYRIPDFQRGYAWGNSQLKEFWTDIVQLEVGSNHYFGVLTLELASQQNYNTWIDDVWIVESKNFVPYYIVDGQQRLTTVIILLQVILELLPDGFSLNYDTINEIRKKYIFDTKDGGISRSYIFGYEKDNPSYEYLKTVIFNEHSEAAYQKEETIYTNNLYVAKQFFHDRLEEFEVSKLEELYRKITQNLLFNIYSIKDEIDVFVTFETMNNRGKPLSLLELLKNRLIYLSTKLKCGIRDKIYLRKKINETWKGIYHFLGKNKDNPLNDDEFLVAHFTLYFYKLSERIKNRYHYYFNMKQVCQEELFDEIFTISRMSTNNNLEVKEIDDYIVDLQKTVEVWYAIHNPTIASNIPENDKALVDKLNKLDFEEIAPLLTLFYLKNSKKKDNSSSLQLLERYFFIDTILYYRDDLINLDCSETAIAILNGEYTFTTFFNELNDKLKMLTKDSSFGPKLIKRMTFVNFYNWKAIKYFLYEYELSIKEKTKNSSLKIDWNQFNMEKKDFVTIEHIFPQVAKDRFWVERYKQFSIKEKRILRNSLGNLLALSRPKNSSLQNFDFLTKIESKKEYIGYRYGSYSEIEVSKFSDWTYVEIKDRGLKLVKFMEKRWGFKFKNDTERIKFLGLDFLDN